MAQEMWSLFEPHVNDKTEFDPGANGQVASRI